jgi:integrase
MQTRERKQGNKVLQGVKNSTLLTYANRIKSFCKWLTDRQYISHNPFDGFVLPKPSYADKRALSGDQIKRMMGALAQSAYDSFLFKRDIAMISTLTFCGLRKNELLSLELRDLDLFENVLIVRPETSKSKIYRRIPIGLQLKKHLQEYLSVRKAKGYKTPLLFSSHSADIGLTSHGLKHWVARITKLSGVRFHVHRFRHTFATNLAMQDVGIIKIQKLMGHADIKMTQTYLRSVSTEDMREDVNKLSFENLA